MTKADFAARFGRMAVKVQIDPVYQVKDVGVSGDLAYAWSHVTVVFTAKVGGLRTERSGHVLAIFRRSSAGVWQVARSAKLIPVVDNPDKL